MTVLLAWTTFLLLLGIAGVHVYWAFGGVWPAKERALLPRVVAASNDTRMPPVPITLIVAALIFVAGLLPLMWTGVLPLLLPGALVALALWGLVAVFLGRGLVTYTPIGKSVFAVEPFNGLNRKYYSPLCIVLGVMILVIRIA